MPAIDEQLYALLTIFSAQPIMIGGAFITKMYAATQRIMVTEMVIIIENDFKNITGHVVLYGAMKHAFKFAGVK